MITPDPGGKKGNGKGSRTPETTRKKRVDRIKGKVDTGTYRVKPKKVADKMVDDAVRRIRSRDKIDRNPKR